VNNLVDWRGRIDVLTHPEEPQSLLMTTEHELGGLSRQRQLGWSR